ncbi:hypothetical protein N9D98_02735 [Amylibacter sp.]|nr:hypothetical protein [Amylibacter sp.]
MSISEQIDFTVLCDNIIEFDRFFEIACLALQINKNDFTYKKNIPVVLYLEKPKISFTALVGFGRWGDNYWTSSINKSLFISENPDVLIELKTSKIKKIFAIEFCSALPAGNQSWQRYARGKELSKNGTDYFFVSELGGVELGDNRKEIAIRYPNPIVNYAAKIENEKPKTGNFINLLVEKPGCSDSLSNEFKNVLGTTLLKDYLLENLGLIQKLSGNRSHQDNLIKKYISKKNKKSLFEDDFYNSNIVNPKKSGSEQWKKIFSIPVTDDTNKILLLATSYSNPYFGSNLPFTLIESTASKCFIQSLNKITKQNIVLPKKDDVPNVFFVAIAGFKPKGDDARPDRGLVPLVDSLSKPEDLVITLLFGPAPLNNKDELLSNPIKLAKKNGLWGSILQNSDYIICTSRNFPKTILVSGFRGETTSSKFQFKIRDIDKIPKVNENDVDTAVHLVCNRDCGLFESLCNPPGGDWSGVSFYNKEIKSEIRYLTLSRAPDKKLNKRPDHIYHYYEENTVIVVESKTTFSSLLKEKEVGKKMVFWTKYLLSHIPQVKKNVDGLWSKSTNEEDKLLESNFIRCGAFTYKNETEKSLNHLMNECSLDLILVYKITDNVWNVEIMTNSSNKSIPKCFEHLDRLSF